jgi:2-polyprenyl-3-methyl-5-hydroxy-6-metoxy-1,4-benzoquinol methylase
MLLSYDAREYWNRRARRYREDNSGWKAVCVVGDADWANSYIHSLQVRAVSRVLKVLPGMRILDVGCGVGRWSLRFAQQGALVSACDISEEMIRIARERSENLGFKIDFFVQPIEEVPSDIENQFDIVTSFAVLQHITERDRFLRACMNLVKAAKPNGQIVVLETFSSKSTRCMLDTHVALRTRLEFVRALEEAGAILIREMGVRFMRLDEYWRRLAGKLARPLYGFDSATSNIEILETLSKGRFVSRICVLVFNGVRRIILVIQKPGDWFLSPLLTSLSFERVLIFQKCNAIADKDS